KGLGNKTNFLSGKLPAAAILGYQLARSLTFTFEQRSLPLIERLVTGQFKDLTPEEKKHLPLLLKELFLLLKHDSQMCSEGYFPLSVYQTENPQEHLFRLGKILWDGVGISRRRTEKKAKVFKNKEKLELSKYPEYYQRNFHYQTNGYLSEQSAELYEHQVEILFSGGADAMRRLLIPLIKEQPVRHAKQLRFLEIGAGTGRLTRSMRLAFPEAHITCSELSPAYLKKARQRLGTFPKIDFIQANAEDLPFKDDSFDLVYSCFLFHELPLTARKHVIKEGKRVLKPGGLFGLVDSLQKNDRAEFNWALRRFPTDFHEPFFKNYSITPMEKLVKDTSQFELVGSEKRLLAKALLFRK
ncbi:MAG: class I SAM-dependent methyltransferase, partial [Bdellovibrionota bacterium]